MRAVVTCQPAGIANEIPYGSVTRETDVSASVIAQTNSIATQAFRLYTAIRSFGSALKPPALNRRLRSQHGRGRQVEPPTTANGGKSEGSAIAKRPDEGWRVTKTKLQGVAQDLAVDVGEQPGLTTEERGPARERALLKKKGRSLGDPGPFLVFVSSSASSSGSPAYRFRGR